VKYLLDTDTCIYWLKGRQSVKKKILAVGYSEITISVITVAELYFGAYNSTKIEENLATADKFIESLTVLQLNRAALKCFGELKAELRQKGTPLADFDLLIASIAISKGLVLVSNNVRHYIRLTHLNLENWFSG